MDASNNDVLHLVGLATVSGVGLYLVLAIFNFVYTYFLMSGKNLKKYGEWAGTLRLGPTLSSRGMIISFDMPRNRLGVCEWHRISSQRHLHS